MSATLQELRVLVLAPTGRDGANTQILLEKAGIDSAQCHDLDEVCREIRRGAGAVLLTEECLGDNRAAALEQILAEQPHWSDLPFIVLTRGGPDSPAALRAIQTLGNVVLLERPVRVSTCVTAARTALRARARQYQTRGYLEELQDTDQRKNEFLAMLAHELRNPLAPIRTAMSVMQLTAPGDDKLQAMRAIVERQVSHLSRLVDDLLDISRITRGKVEIKKDKVSLAEVIASAVETSRPLLDRAHQKLVVELPEEPVILDGDLTRLAQVVSNLLNNASKYTPERGHIWLTANAQGKQVVIRVRDDGIGIPTGMLGKVFDLFTQLDSSLARANGGLGIGLTLVRSIVEMHGGSVRAVSAGPGHGSEFIVRLPRAPQPAQSPEIERGPQIEAPRSSRRILVVDDNKDAADSLTLLLREAGHEVATAYGGIAALKLAASFRPEVVVLDIGLPGMDGYEVAGRVRDMPEIGEPLVLALTGYAQAQDRERARVCGFDHYLIKPADFRELQALLARPHDQRTH